MLRTILIDDEANSLNALKEKLIHYCPSVNIIGTCTNAEEGKKAINILKPDLVFTDIEMPVTNGFLMLQQLTHTKFSIVFVTAYHHYALKAIKFSALDYLVKPVDIDELKAAVEKANAARRSTNKRLELLLKNFENNEHLPERIAIPMLEGFQFMEMKNIAYMEANNNYTRLYLTDGEGITVSRTLKEFEDMLPADKFFRIHHSYLINTDYLERYIIGEGGQVIMNTGATLPVSKRKKNDFLKLVKR
ncbi:MAG: LytTR family DNA-binding domain-containing protein [Chitinophagaceae bacterium]|jgi:two-component system LytT family response regulator|nr:LytTR family DNA-binding domain-containing protein [Chitinophagaceae bacterium]